jgi:Na+/melibiose symporter-like transporter
MASYIPTVGAIIAVVALWFYPLDEPMVERMVADLKVRRAGESGVPAAAPAGGH